MKVPIYDGGGGIQQKQLMKNLISGQDKPKQHTIIEKNKIELSLSVPLHCIALHVHKKMEPFHVRCSIRISLVLRERRAIRQPVLRFFVPPSPSTAPT